MTIDVWQTCRDFVAVTGFAVTTYKSYGSPYTSLTKSEKKLERVRAKLKEVRELSPEQRAEIETAIRSQDVGFTSLEDLEEQLKDLSNMFSRLSKRYEDATLAERHFPSPYSQIRSRVSTLEILAKALLNDTLKTTVPSLDDIDFDPNTLRERPSSSESPDPNPLRTVTVS